MSKAKEWAEKLNGREYTEELTREEEAQAKADRVLIVFGASDDLTEFRGILRWEEGAYDGINHCIRHTRSGWKIDDEAPAHIGDYVDIRAEFSPEEFSPEDLTLTWRISADVPAETFTIVDDGDAFCVGLVIDEQDMIRNRAVIDYTNHRGERRERLIASPSLAFQKGNPYHWDAYILTAYDLEKREWRDFAMANVHSWREVKP